MTESTLVKTRKGAEKKKEKERNDRIGYNGWLLQSSMWFWGRDQCTVGIKITIKTLLTHTCRRNETVNILTRRELNKDEVSIHARQKYFKKKNISITLHVIFL